MRKDNLESLTLTEHAEGRTETIVIYLKSLYKGTGRFEKRQSYKSYKVVENHDHSSPEWTLYIIIEEEFTFISIFQF